MESGYILRTPDIYSAPTLVFSKFRGVVPWKNIQRHWGCNLKKSVEFLGAEFVGDLQRDKQDLGHWNFIQRCLPPHGPKIDSGYFLCTMYAWGLCPSCGDSAKRQNVHPRQVPETGAAGGTCPFCPTSSCTTFLPTRTGVPHHRDTPSFKVLRLDRATAMDWMEQARAQRLMNPHPPLIITQRSSLAAYGCTAVDRTPALPTAGAKIWVWRGLHTTLAHPGSPVRANVVTWNGLMYGFMIPQPRFLRTTVIFPLVSFFDGPFLGCPFPWIHRGWPNGLVPSSFLKAAKGCIFDSH